MKSGDQCPRCDGRLQVVCTRVEGDYRYRWIGCRSCGFRPEDNKRVIPLEFAPAQPPRK